MKLGAILAGFVVGNILLAAVVHWMMAVVEIRKLGVPHPWQMVASTSLFNSGPWMLGVAGMFAYYTHSEPWAPWVLGGAVGWFAYFGLLMATARRRG